jgi:hypothetical protein
MQEAPLHVIFQGKHEPEEELVSNMALKWFTQQLSVGTVFGAIDMSHVIRSSRTSIRLMDITIDATVQRTK